jgi:hypothetical protein
MHRRASLDASGSSLNAMESARRVERLFDVPSISEPVGFFPRVFRARSAWAASGRGRYQAAHEIRMRYRVPFVVSPPVEALPLRLHACRSLKRTWIRSVRLD